MNNHYFIGIKVPPATAERLVDQRDAWGLSGHRRYPIAEDLHITLLFIGGDTHGEIAEVAEALKGIQHSPFELKITGTAHFGKSDRPRVVYAALEENERLNGLHRKVKDALSSFRLSPDNKPFVPHITLANKWAGKDVWEEIPQIESESFRAEEFSLFRIEPAGKPRYIAVETYQLKDGV